jgi:hypothetical protein
MSLYIGTTVNGFQAMWNTLHHAGEMRVYLEPPATDGRPFGWQFTGHTAALFVERPVLEKCLPAVCVSSKDAAYRQYLTCDCNRDCDACRHALTTLSLYYQDWEV